MFATFHMLNPAVFYNREDQWEIPAFDVGGQSQSMHPYYTIMKLPGEAGPEYIQMLPFTPRQKDNLAAWMVARSDGANYGKLAVFQFPEADGDLRSEAGRRAHQPGPGDRAADHAVEPAGLRGHPGHAAGDPDRGVADLHPSAVPEGGGRLDPRAEARHRRLPEPDRDGRDARRRARADLPRRRPSAGPPVDAGAARCGQPAAPPRRSKRRAADVPRSPTRRAPTTSARSRPSATATGRSTARRSRSSASPREDAKR